LLAGDGSSGLFFMGAISSNPHINISILTVYINCKYDNCLYTSLFYAEIIIDRHKYIKAIKKRTKIKVF